MRSQTEMQRKFNIPARRLFILMGMSVILIAVAAVLMAGISSDRTAQYAEAQDALAVKEQAQLTEIKESLHGIDKIVMANGERLNEVSLADTEKILADFSETLFHLEKNLTMVETSLKDFSGISTSGNTAINTTLGGLFNRQGEIREQVVATMAAIKDILSDMESGRDAKFSETFNQLYGLKDTAKDIRKNTTAYYKDLVNVIGHFQEDTKVGHEELTDTLKAIADEFNVQIIERFAATQKQLEQEYIFLTEQMETMQESGSLNHEETVSAIKDLSGSMAESADHNLSEITGFLQDMENEFTSLANELQDSTAQSFADRQESENTNHEETMEALVKAEKNMAEIAGRNLESANHFLTAMQSDFNTLIAKIQKDMTQNFDIARETENNNHSDTMSSLTDVENAITGNANQNLIQAQKSLQEIQDNFNTLIVSLKNEVAQGFEDLSDIDSKLADLENNITNEAGKNLDEAKRSLQSVRNQMDAIFNGLQNNMSQGFGILQGTTAAYHADTISAISDLEDRLIENASQKSAGISSSIEDMNNRFSDSINTVQNDMVNRFSSSGKEISDTLTQLAADLAGQIGQLDSSISSQYDSLSTTISNNNTGQQQNYDNLLNEIRQDLQAVFQSASDGKQLIASALLAKTISIDKDATFDEIYQGIMDIPQQVVIGVVKLPGTVTYDCHYHADGSGNEPHADKTDTKGGCYTVPVYHAHNSGCYKTNHFHKHNDGCPGHPMWVHWMNPPYWGWAHDCGNQPQNASEQVLNCAKNSGTVDAYQAGCGFSDGQITGAHIVYTQNASTIQAAQVTEAVGTVENTIASPAVVPAESPEAMASADSADTPAAADLPDAPADTDTADITEPLSANEAADIAESTGSTESQSKAGIPGQTDTEDGGTLPGVSGNTLMPGPNMN